MGLVPLGRLGDGVNGGASTEAVHSYITDMLALEDHIDKAIMAQVEDFDPSSAVRSAR